MKRYQKCSNAIFDERLGEYKCSERQTTVSDTTACNGCRKFKVGTPKASINKQDEDELTWEASQ